MKTDLTVDYVNKRCEELGLVRCGDTSSEFSGWWSIRMHDGRSFEVAEWPSSKRTEAWVCFPESYTGISNNMDGIVRCYTLDEFETELQNAVKQANQYVVDYYNNSIDEALKKLD